MVEFVNADVERRRSRHDADDGSGGMASVERSSTAFVFCDPLPRLTRVGDR